jgi:peptide deformylase
VAINKQVFFMSGDFYVNPTLIGFDLPRKLFEEESLFWPGLAQVKSRHTRVELQYLTLHGDAKVVVLEDLEAVCAQHILDAFSNVPFISAASEL